VKTEAAYITAAGQCEVMTTELPPLGASEVLMKVVSSSMCYSTYKAMTLGSSHKRVPDGLNETPVMTGHEFAGVIEEVGENHKDRYHKGQLIAVQPAMGLPSGYSPGYSYPYYGGDATYTIIPEIAIEKGGILPYEEEYFANASLAEPMSCIIGAFHASYHTTPFVYDYEMGIKKGGNLALLGAAGPMGIGAIDYAINGPYQPKLIVVTDLDQARLDRAASLIPPSVLDGTDRRLVYINTSKIDDEVAAVRAVSGDQGYDDVMVLVPDRGLIETADKLLGVDGCLNFFAGPTDKSFSASINFYNVHYERTHLVGTSGGSSGDMQESLTMSAAGKLNPSLMVTHVGGIDAVPPTLKGFPSIPGGKKLFYPHVHLPLVAIDEFRAHAEQDPRFAGLADICEANNNVWNLDAERYLLAHWA
jgi:L-sorbose 1-phosphate reductase